MPTNNILSFNKDNPITGGNVGTNVGTNVSTGTLSSWVKNKQSFIDNKKQEAAAIATNERDKENDTLFECSLNSTDPTVIKKYTSASRLGYMSEMMRNWNKEKYGFEIDKNVNPGDVICTYLNAFPNQQKTISDYIDGNIELEDAATKLGFITRGDVIKKSENKGTVAGDIAQGIMDSLMGLGTFASKYAAKGVGGVAKALGADEEKTDYYVNDFVNYMENEATDLGVNANKDSLAYTIPNVSTDLLQLVVPGVGEEKGIYLLSKLSKIPAIGKLLQSAEGMTNFAANHPKLTKVLTNAAKDGYEGVRDMILLNAINGEGTNISEMAEGGLSNVALNPAFKGLGKIGQQLPGIKTIVGKGAEKLEVMGNLNSTEMRKAMKALAQRGEFNGQSYTPADVGKWMLERNVKGSKDDMYKQLLDHTDSAMGLLDETLAQSTSIHNVPKATEALNSIADDMRGVPGMGDDLEEVLSLVKQGDNYTLTELEKVKRTIDKYEEIYTNAGDVKAGFKAKGMDKIRKNIKLTIEDVAKQEGLGDIRALNNEIAMGKTIALGLGNKSASEILNQRTSGALGSLGTAIAGGDIGQASIMGIVTGLLGSTTFRTNVANAIKNIGGIEEKTLKEVLNFVESKGTSELSSEGQSILKKALSQSKELREDLRRAGQTGIIRWLDDNGDEL